MSPRNIIVSVLILIAAGYGSTKAFMYYQAKQRIDRLIAPVSIYVDIGYESISTSLFGPVGIKGLKIRSWDGGGEILFSKVTLQSFEIKENEQLPSYMHITFDDVQFSTAVYSNLSQDVPELIKKLGYTKLYNAFGDLKSLGYDEIVMDMYFELFYNKKNGNFKVKFGEAIENLGELDILFDLLDVFPTVGISNMQAKIKEISLDYKDKSYIERLIKKFSQQNNQDMEVYRTELVNKLGRDLAAHKLDLGSEALQELKKFITKPGRLTVTVNPYDPVAIDSLKFYKIEDVPKLLNVQIYAQ